MVICTPAKMRFLAAEDEFHCAHLLGLHELSLIRQVLNAVLEADNSFLFLRSSWGSFEVHFLDLLKIGATFVSTQGCLQISFICSHSISHKMVLAWCREDGDTTISLIYAHVHLQKDNKHPLVLCTIVVCLMGVSSTSRKYRWTVHGAPPRLKNVAFVLQIRDSLRGQSPWLSHFILPSMLAACETAEKQVGSPLVEDQTLSCKRPNVAMTHWQLIKMCVWYMKINHRSCFLVLIS